MKNFHLLIFMIPLLSLDCLGQSAYKDAIEIKRLSSPRLSETTGVVALQLDTTENRQDSLILVLLKYYSIEQQNKLLELEKRKKNLLLEAPIVPSKIDEINGWITDTLKSIDNPFFEIAGQVQNNDPLKILEPKSFGSKIGGLNVTTFADGLAQFLVERAMEELDVAFFSKFKSFLVKNPEAKILFPTTTDYISNFSPHEYALFIVSLRESFYNDLKNLIYNVDDVFLLPKYVELIDNHPEIIISINCIQMIVDLEEGSHPMEVLEKLKDLEAWEKESIETKPSLVNLRSGLRASYILANSVRKVENDTLRDWISINDFRTNILEDSVAFKIFLGLIYQQVKNEDIRFSYLKSKTDSKVASNATKPLAEFLLENKDRFVVFQSLFSEIIQKGALVDQSIREITNIQEPEKPIKEQYYKFINASVDIIEFGFKVSTLVVPNEAKNKYDTYFTLARQGNNLYRNVYQKQYSAAILNASSIFELTFEEVKRSKTSEALAGDAKADTKKITKSLDEQIKVLPDILRYGTFMANIIEAEEPSQVKAAIESAVLPVGSSTVKKYYRHNISINAYLGGFYRFKEVEIVQQSWDARFGFTAPVGISYTPFSFGKGGALSLFLPLIDVGALAQFRISDTTSQIEEDISLGNIFSPGIFAVYGLPLNLPISIGFGRQYGPGLVSFDASTPNVINPSWRTNFFLAVDIPLFNLSKGKRFK